MDILTAYQEQFHLHVREARPASDSNSSQVFLLVLSQGERAVLKIPFHNAKYQREKTALALLEGKLSVPKILDCFDGDDRLGGALLLTFLEGQAPTSSLNPDTAFQIGAALGTIHSVPLKKYGELDVEGPVDPPAVYIEEQLHAFERSCGFCAQVMDPKLVERCRQIVIEHFASTPCPTAPCMIHADFRLGNILARENGQVGIIDFEVANGSIPERDFSLLRQELFLHNPQAEQEFWKGYRTVRALPDLDAIPFYTFLTAFHRIGWCVKRNKTTEPFYAEFRRQVAEYVSLR